MQFIGLTSADADETERFVRNCEIPWPTGYGAEQTVEQFVGAAPTIFVIGRDGQIVWNDDRSRFRHALHGWRTHLQAAIESALAVQW